MSLGPWTLVGAPDGRIGQTWARRSRDTPTRSNGNMTIRPEAEGRATTTALLTKGRLRSKHPPCRAVVPASLCAERSYAGRTLTKVARSDGSRATCLRRCAYEERSRESPARLRRRD